MDYMDNEDQYLGRFDPKEYLRQYYSLSQLARDDEVLVRLFANWLRGPGRLHENAIDFGCGPTLHYAFVVAPWVKYVDMADYMDANLEQIRIWVDEQPGCHDWDPVLRGVLECDRDGAQRMIDRKRLFRQRVRRLIACDLRLDRPVPGGDPSYDLVTTFFCSECVAGTMSEWREMFGRIIGLVAPGGDLFVSCLRSASRYRIMGQWFDCLSVTERDIEDELIRHGFSPDSIQSVVADAPDWIEAGFEQIVVVGAKGRFGIERP
jgi:hypothetical protein